MRTKVRLVPGPPVSGKRRQSAPLSLPCPLYPPVPLVLVNAHIQGDLTHWFPVFPGQGYHLGFKFRGIYPPFFVLLSRLLLLLHYISRLFLYLPDGIRSNFFVSLLSMRIKGSLPSSPRRGFHIIPATAGPPQGSNRRWRALLLA